MMNLFLSFSGLRLKGFFFFFGSLTHMKCTQQATCSHWPYLFIFLETKHLRLQSTTRPGFRLGYIVSGQRMTRVKSTAVNGLVTNSKPD